MENNSIVRKHIIFYGYVQGVGFRYRARHAADLYGCTGWVRNEWDGSVSMEIQGEESQIDQVVCGGESGDEARLCDYAWVMDTMCQCVKYKVPFHFKQTGANFKRGEQIYHIPRKDQQIQAAKAKIDYMPPERFRKELYENEEQRYPDLYQLSLPL